MDPVISDLNRHLDKIECDEAFGEAVEKKLLEYMEDSSTVRDALEVDLEEFGSDTLDLIADIIATDDVALWQQNVTRLRAILKTQLRSSAEDAVNEDIAEAEAEAAEAEAEARAARMGMSYDV